MTFDNITEFLRTPWGLFLTVFFFGASIFVHELGHFLAAKYRGLKIDCFSIGFGPSIWSQKDKDGVEWKLCWFPFGGYVRLPQLGEMEGLEGESDTPAESLPPISYADKMIVSVMGAVFNILFAFALACMLWPTPDKVQVQDTATVIGSITPTVVDAEKEQRVVSPAKLAGLLPGDKILTVDGKAVKDFSEIMMAVILGAGRSPDGRPQTVMTIERAGVTKEITLYPTLTTIDKIRILGIEPLEKLVVGGVSEGKPAAKAGVLPGDEIIKADGVAMYSIDAFTRYLKQKGDSPVEITFKRGEQLLVKTITPELTQIDGEPKPRRIIGIGWQPVYASVHIAPWTRIWTNAEMMYRNISALIDRNTNIGVKSFSGPLGIGKVLYRAAKRDFRFLISLVILINVNLAILNLMPVPVLDGGHMLIATINRFSRKSLSTKVIQTVQSVFAALLICLMLYVSGRDVLRFIAGDGPDPAQTEETTPPQPSPAEPAK